MTNIQPTAVTIRQRPAYANAQAFSWESLRRYRAICRLFLRAARSAIWGRANDVIAAVLVTRTQAASDKIQRP
jgi:hypothetical protein